MNSYIERFNRTLKEEFVNESYYDLIFNIDEFNRKLMEYLSSITQKDLIPLLTISLL